MQKFSTCLWFDQEAEDAAQLYTSCFRGRTGTKTLYNKASVVRSPNSVDSLMTIEFEIENQKILGLNGGPLFNFSPSLSLYVTCDSSDEIESLWEKLSPGGKTHFALDHYPWAELYAFFTDRFGLAWQLILPPANQRAGSSPDRKIVPAFLFTDKLLGQGQAAVDFYTRLFPNSKIEFCAKDEPTGHIVHARFLLNGQTYVLMEGAGQHDYKFSESTSIVVNCDTQEEIDFYWTKLTTDGGTPGQSGWLKDKFGVSWQIVPANLEDGQA